jgi:16S rRNA C1402 N4-methylase RsmH
MDDESMLLAISFHSLEERLIQQHMQKWKKEGLGTYGTKKPLLPSEEEL